MTPSIKVACFNLQARKEGRPFRAAPSSDLRAGLAVHLLGPSVGNFLTCSSTWERRCWRRSIYPWPHPPALLWLRRS
jgi:hypothetical protein